MSAFVKLIVTGLATLGTVQALPNYPAGAPSSAVASSSAAAPTAAAPAPQDNTSLFQSLFTAPTAIKRFQKLLTSDGKGDRLLTGDALKKQIVFDFNGAKPAAGSTGGATKAANIETFPILIDLGISTTLGFLGACGMNTPHVHPRATEFLTVVEGSVKFGYILENGLVASGSAEVAGQLNKFQGSVFPMGSIHYQFNPSCDDAIFVATLNSEDPGTSQIAQNFFGLNPDVVNSTLGFPKTIDGKNIDEFRKSLPVNLAQAIDTCIATCDKKAHKTPKTY